MNAPLFLSDILEGWPEELGETLSDLVNLPIDAVREILTQHDPELGQYVWALRAQATNLVRGSEREAGLGGPQQVETALRNGLLRPRTDWWIIYPLDSKMRRVPAPHKNGGSRFVVDLRKKFPHPDEVHAVNSGGAYLAAWGGSPRVCEIPGVAERIIAFANHHNLTDVCFWQLEEKVVSSLRFGVGQGTAGPVELPQHPLTMKARTAWQ